MIKFSRDMLTCDELRRRYHYSPETGLFTRRTSRGVNYPVGMVAGCTSRGYRYIRIGDCSFAAHRLAWLYTYGEMPDGLIDHIDGNPLNNRISNLRVVDATENAWNKGPNPQAKSGFKGVSWHKAAKKWQAQLSSGKTNYHLGYFDDPVEAARVYEVLALELRGKYHRVQKLPHHPKL